MIMVPPVRTLCGNCNDVEPFNLGNGLQSVHTFPGLAAGDQVFCLDFGAEMQKECDRLSNLKTRRENPNRRAQRIRGSRGAGSYPEKRKEVLFRSGNSPPVRSCAGINLSPPNSDRAAYASGYEAAATVRGDDLCDKYAETLPDDFKKRVPSLKEIYGKLSDAMHQAKDDVEVFDSQAKDIVKHCDT